MGLHPALRRQVQPATELLEVTFLMLDEAMSGWRPKTSALGGLPNITSELPKPVDLGSMYRDSVECITGIFVHHNIVQAPTQQWRKKYLNPPTKSGLPKKEIIPYHTTKVLYQAENSKVVPRGWVGGNA